jgi:hypothetical protein
VEAKSSHRAKETPNSNSFGEFKADAKESAQISSSAPSSLPSDSHVDNGSKQSHVEPDWAQEQQLQSIQRQQAIIRQQQRQREIALHEQELRLEMEEQEVEEEEEEQEYSYPGVDYGEDEDERVADHFERLGLSRGDGPNHLRKGVERHEDDIDCNDNDLAQDRAEVDEAAALFAYSTMSLEMDNDDLLFNLLYFGDAAAGGGTDLSTLGSTLNTAMEETLAAHSAGNTPYKLRPAEEGVLGQLANHYEVELTHKHLSKHGILELTLPAHGSHDSNSGAERITCCDEIECQVCKDIMEEGQVVIPLPVCMHVFHKDCLMRWLRLQSWCPVCRSKIDEETISSCIKTAEENATVPHLISEEEETEQEESPRTINKSIPSAIAASASIPIPGQRLLTDSEPMSNSALPAAHVHNTNSGAGGQWAASSVSGEDMRSATY